ncbi:MAG: nitroreductase family protein [Desulfobulbaceae bacterium]|jgi:nitroreductase|nr:nitroreductase family protein [Desulfobulbaceae bacterium]
MKIGQLVAQTRTVRRFQQERPVDEAFLHGLIDLARLSGCARNAQALQFIPVCAASLCAQIFPHLAWAGYLTDWKGPESGERPPAYILCLVNEHWHKGPDTEIYCDVGIATQSMLLAAAASGIFGCRIGAFSPALHGQLRLAANHRIVLVVALGYPAEEVVLEELRAGGDIRYWRDTAGVHHVPKRPLQDVLLLPSDPA